MRNWTYDRGAALGGIAYFLLVGAAASIAPTTLELDLNASDVRRELAGHANALGASAVLTALAMLALGCFIAAVSQRLKSSDPDGGSSLPICFTLAGAAVIIIGLLGASLQAIVAHHGADLDDASLVMSFRLWQVVSYNLSALPAGVMLLLAGGRTLRTAVFPKWLGVVAILGAVGGMAAVSSLYITGNPVPVLDIGGFALANLWIVAASVAAVIRPVPAPRPVPSPVAA